MRYIILIITLATSTSFASENKVELTPNQIRMLMKKIISETPCEKLKTDTIKEVESQSDEELVRIFKEEIKKGGL